MSTFYRLVVAVLVYAGCARTPAQEQEKPEETSQEVFSADGLDPALNADPACGVAGQTVVLITGSGWPEPAPPCTYFFYFDGEEIGQQADGLYGPPYHSFTVPEDAEPGCGHTIRVDLRLNSGELQGTAEIPFCVVKVSLVEWRELVGYGGTNNPAAAVPQIAAAKAGKRHFPDAASAMAAAKNEVRVRAKLEPACPNVEIFFRNFDPDDPSASTAPIDNDTGTSHNDNRGTPQPGTLGAASVTTDAAGFAETTFTTTMQPGDNFLVAASAGSDWVSTLTQEGWNLRDSDSQVLEPGDVIDDGAVTPLLTIWRLLHLEIDSMRAPNAMMNENRVTGSVTASTCVNVPTPGGGSRGVCRYTIDAAIADGQNSYEGGWIDIGMTRFNLPERGSVNTVINTSGAAPNTVRALRPGGGVCPPMGMASGCAAAGGNFVLHDDDTDTVLPRWPALSLLQSTDAEATNRLFRAFIRPMHDAGGDQNNLAFAKNTTNEETQVAAGKSCQSVAAYWCGYQVNLFQYKVAEDGDPDNEAGLYGVAAGTLGFGSVANNGATTFIEFHRDLAQEQLNPQATAAVLNQQILFTNLHEFGHTLWACHGDNGVMCYPDFVALADNRLKFRDPSIARARWLQRPGSLLAGANGCTHTTDCD